jgi:hypothetical protein
MHCLSSSKPEAIGIDLDVEMANTENHILITNDKGFGGENI